MLLCCHANTTTTTTVSYACSRRYDAFTSKTASGGREEGDQSGFSPRRSRVGAAFASSLSKAKTAIRDEVVGVAWCAAGLGLA